MLKKLCPKNIIIIFFTVMFLAQLQLSYADDNSFTVNIPNPQGGYIALNIEKSGSGYTGPKGEYYSQFPSVYQLQAVYETAVQSNDVQREKMLEQQADEQNKAEIQKEIKQQQVLNQQIQQNFQQQQAQQQAKQQAQQQAQLQTQQNIQQQQAQATLAFNIQDQPKQNLPGTAGIKIFILSLIGIGILFYFLPSIIAFSRKHLNFTPILLVNILLGWTFIGWVVALVWSFSHQEKKA